MFWFIFGLCIETHQVLIFKDFCSSDELKFGQPMCWTAREALGSTAMMLWQDIKIQTEDVCEKAFVEPKRWDFSIIMAVLLLYYHCLPSIIILLVSVIKCGNKGYLDYRYKFYNSPQFMVFSLFPVTALSCFLRTVIIRKQLQHWCIKTLLLRTVHFTNCQLVMFK